MDIDAPDWRSGWPGEATQPDVLARELRTAIMRTSRRLRTEASGDVVSPGQYTVLAQLRRGSRTSRELAERERVQAPSMTRIVKALTAKGLVSRAVHPQDGRQILLSITPDGEGILEEAKGQRTAWLSRRVALLDEEDRLVLSRAAHLLQELSAE
ncbi:MarR family transcriptional regulator [Arthrobacter bambusae]|nr:MarR family transcriptional regulator [Arthrobacter bambusae]